MLTRVAIERQARDASDIDLLSAERTWARKRGVEARTVRAAFAAEIRTRDLGPGTDRRRAAEREQKLRDELRALDRREHEVYDHYGPAGQGELRDLGAQRARIEREIERLC